MELTPKLNENVMDAIAEALKGLKPRPAVDRVLTARLTGKWGHYAQVLLTYSPSEFGVAYVNLAKPSEPKVTIHDAESKGGKHATAKELKRLKRIEKREAAKAKAAERKPATVKVKSTTKKMPVVAFNKDLSTLEGSSERQVKK
jgi:hypothetical protein